MYKSIVNVRGPGIRWSGNSSGIQGDLKDTDCNKPGTTELASTKRQANRLQLTVKGLS